MSGLKDTAVSALRATRDVGGRLTPGSRMLPSFLICGAQRAGTTSMFRTLEQHPNVIAPPLRKGIHYFDLVPEKSMSFYRSRFPLRRASDRVQRETGRAAITGESSPYYGWHPLAAERIAAALPGVKVIVLVRDPVERAYSAHAHEIARGFETEPFAQAIELEPSRLEGAEEILLSGGRSMAHQHQAYLSRGVYWKQLERLAGAVGRDHVHVVDSGAFFEQPEKAFAQTLEFLDLPIVGGITFEQHNARGRSSMDPVLRAELSERFVEDDDKLVPWLGAVPSWRR